MSLTDDDAKEIIKTLALRRDNAFIIIGGFITVVLTFFTVILALQGVLELLKSPIPAYAMGSIFFIIAFVLCISTLNFYRKDVAIKDKIKEVSEHPHLKEFYAGIFPEEQKTSTVRVKADVLLQLRKIFGVGILLRVRQIFGVFLIFGGGYIVWRGYVLLSSSYLSPQSSMTGLNIIIVPLETTALYIVGLLFVILGFFMAFGKDKVLNWAQK